MKPWPGWHELDEEQERVELLVDGLSVADMVRSRELASATVQRLPERLVGLDLPAGLTARKRSLLSEARQLEKQIAQARSKLRRLRWQYELAVMVERLRDVIFFWRKRR